MVTRRLLPGVPEVEEKRPARPRGLAEEDDMHRLTRRQALRLGTGAALGISIIEAAARTLNEMATFAEAGVSEGE